MAHMIQSRASIIRFFKIRFGPVSQILVLRILWVRLLESFDAGRCWIFFEEACLQMPQAYRPPNQHGTRSEQKSRLHIGGYIGDYCRVVQGDTRSSDYSLCSQFFKGTSLFRFHVC